MGIREDKKNLYREKILTIAREVFTEQGFDNTTIEQIAERAEIGLGTTYNYFKSKEELFLLSMADEIANTTEIHFDEIPDEPKEVYEIVDDAIMKFIKKMNWNNKKLWKIAFPVIMSNMKSDKFPLRQVLRADFIMMEKIAELINKLKTDGFLSSDFDTRTAMDLIFGSLYFQLVLFIYTDELTFDQVTERIQRDIQYVFEGRTVY